MTATTKMFMGPRPLVPEFPRPYRDAYPLTKHCSKQMDLFSSSLKELGGETRVSIAEMRRWHNDGISSVEPDPDGRYHTADRAELLFLSGIMRSGLPEERVQSMLQKLEKPYAYHPYATVYSFSGNRWFGLDPGETGNPFYCYMEFWRRIMLESHPDKLYELRDAIDQRLYDISHKR